MHSNPDRAWRCVVAALLALCVGSPTMSASSKSARRVDTPMMNFGVIWEGRLTRSGLPNRDSGWKWLRQHGTKGIVTFIPDDDVDYAGYGFTSVLESPLDDDGESPPTQRQAERFLAFIQDPKNQPVHIHCAKGRDRTGLMAALARFAVDGWSLDRALAEARTFRGGEDLGEEYVKWLKAWAAKYPPGNARFDRGQPPTR